MSTFIGVKLVELMAMNLGAYNVYRGWELPSDENSEDAGYLVEYLDGGKANDERHKGYITWSPKDVCDRAYRPADGMTFGLAIEAMQMSKRVARKGWNGKKMWIVLSEGSDGNVICMDPDSDYGLAGLHEVCIDPHIDMYTAKGTMQPGWLASQADMLACDWCIVD